MSIWHQFIGPINRHFRLRRGKFLLNAFPDIATLKICDLGGSRHFWDKVDLPVARDQITIFNIDEGEVQQGARPSAGDIKTVIYDGERIPAADKSFDLVICNSVIEHVPPVQRANLVKEMRRVGRRVFCQTPAWSFPLEPHFLMPFVHWAPRTVGFWLIHLSPWRVLARPDPNTIHNYFWGTRLLKRRDIDALFPKAQVTSERALGMTKSYYVIEGDQFTTTVSVVPGGTRTVSA